MSSWRSVLQEIPTVYGRLAYLAARPDREEDREIRLAHQQLFSQWLTLGISDQIHELRHHAGEPLADYVRLVPLNAREVERSLYLDDMETLLGLLRVEPPGASML